MSIYETQARVGPTGILTLELPVGAQAANREVKVIVEAVEESKVPDAEAVEQWRARIRELAGSIDDPTFFRHPQGEYEVRDEMFP